MSIKIAQCFFDKCISPVYVKWINSLDEEFFFCEKCFKRLEKVYDYAILTRDPILTVKVLKDD